MAGIQQERIPVIQHMLSSVGLKVNLEELSENKNHELTTSILDAFFALLCQSQRHGSQEEDSRERMNQLLMENDALSGNIKKLKGVCENLEQQNHNLSLRLEQAEKSHKDLSKKAQTLNDQLTKEKANNQANATQYKHTLKRLHGEMANLKDRVQKSTNDSLHSQKCKIRLINPLTKPVTSAKVKNEDHFQNVVMSTMEAREKELLVENQDLRNALLHFFSKARKDIFRYCEMEMDLRQQILRQDELIQDAIFEKPMAQDVKSREEEELIAEENRLQKERLEKRLAELEQDRKRFTEAAVKLGLERAALQKERQIFESEKSSFETTKMLHTIDVPVTPMWMKKNYSATYGTPPLRKVKGNLFDQETPQISKEDELRFHGDVDVVNEFDTFSVTPALSKKDYTSPLSNLSNTTSRSTTGVKSVLKKAGFHSTGSKNSRVTIDMQGISDKENLL
ncbi:hypothetical protein HDU97_007145 [Phlyctochytrium planicorne]|nr:hypothetical protein HDU97_007145 [Phlyctochytrium planicorne]